MPGLIVDKVGEGNLNIAVESNYLELQALKNEGKLVPGQKYLVTGYRTMYLISNSDSQGLLREATSTGQLYGAYLIFNEVDVTELAKGMQVTITGLPQGYTGGAKVGDTGTITSKYGTQYFQTSGSIPKIGGLTLAFAAAKYSSELNGKTIKDAHGKDIIKPGGVLNVEVHDGSPYMSMTAAENPPVPVENIIVTAISNTEFDSRAFSETFRGDELIYDFEDSEVKDNNGRVVAQRPGLIKHRTNKDLNISTDKDWRAQRYRRYKMTAIQFDRLKHLEEVYQVNSPTRQYQMFGINGNISQDQEKMFALLDLENPRYLVDFSKNNTEPNIFKNDLVGAKTPTSSLGMGHEYSYDYNLLQSEVTGKDFFIIPLENNEPKKLIEKFKVAKIRNTVFVDQGNSAGNSSNIIIETEEVFNSTFLTGGKLEGSGLVETLTAFDYFVVKNEGKIENTFFYCYLDELINEGVLLYMGIGGAESLPTGGVPSVTMKVDTTSLLAYSKLAFCYSKDVRFEECRMNYSMFGWIFLHASTVKFKSFGVAVKGGYDGHNGNYSWSQGATVNTCLDINFGFGRGGQEFLINKDLHDVTVKTHTRTRKLYLETFDSAGTGRRSVTDITDDGQLVETIEANGVKIPGVNLAAANWVLNEVSGLYEYELQNNLIALSSYVIVGPGNADVAAFITSGISTFCSVSAGAVKMYSKVAPASDVLVDLQVITLRNAAQELG